MRAKTAQGCFYVGVWLTSSWIRPLRLAEAINDSRQTEPMNGRTPLQAVTAGAPICFARNHESSPERSF
jgi:hypothetical protein